MAKARNSVPSTHSEALNAKPSAKREIPEISVTTSVPPPPLSKKVRSSVAIGLRVFPRIMLAFHAMRDDALAPLNCAITTCPMLGPEIFDSQARPFPFLFIIIYLLLLLLFFILSFILSVTQPY